MSTWAIVLAGGDGTRLSEVTRARYGYARPKQFCDFDGRGTLLARTLRRTRLLVPEHRTRVSIASRHRREAADTLAEFPRVGCVEQPANQGTLPGILVPLLHVLREDPSATVLICPSDHHVENEARFAIALATARDLAAGKGGSVALLAADPGGPEDGYGWLVPAGGPLGHPTVAAFREKPPIEELPALIRAGALVNTFVLAARAPALAHILATHAPAWWVAASAASTPAELARAYERLPPSNFSTDVLERIPDRLRIVPVRGSGWSDVGTPERLAAACGWGAAPGAQARPPVSVLA